jgi:hypothetical protein
MTEAEWLTGQDPKGMLDFVSRRAGDRRLRLFAAAAARDLLAHNPAEVRYYGRDVYETAILRAEAMADGEPVSRSTGPQVVWVEYEEAGDAAYTVLGADGSVGLWVFPPEQAVPAALATLTVNPAVWLRDIIGNPFRPAAFDPRWRTDDTAGLARSIYDDRASGRLPLLADALLDAGCDDDGILAHCRSEGPHVRGCWVVDLVLGKE